MKGWLKADPGQQRLPLPLPAVFAICGWLVAHQLIWESFAILLSFRCYLRPGECINLKVKNLVAPAAQRGPYSMWCLDLHPQLDGRPGKTGSYNETVLLDTDRWMYPWFVRLKDGRSADLPLWPHSGRQLIYAFHRA